MKVESLNSLYVRSGTEQKKSPEVIDFEMLKAVLYLGIRGEVNLPMAEKHTIDIFA